MEYLEAFERAIIYIENHLDEAVSVHEVAKASGYSYYHFTRIFQSVLGESVGNYLQKRRLSVRPQIRRIDEIYIAGIRGVAALDDIFALWQQFGEMQGGISNCHPSGRTFGICEYQGDAETANYDMELSEVIGMEVTAYDNLPSGIITKTIPEGKFAVFTRKGPLADLLKTYQYIWGTWALLTNEIIDR